MTNKITPIALLFITTFSISFSLFAMQAEDHLTTLFKTNCPSLSTLIVEKVGSSQNPHQAWKDLYSLASTSTFFKDFFQDQNNSIDLIKYIHKTYSLSLEEIPPFLFFINSEVAYYYYGKKYANETELNPFSKFRTRENSQIRETIAQAIKSHYVGEDINSDRNFKCGPNTMRFLARSWKFLSDTDSSCPKNICSFFSLKKALSVFENALADTLAKELIPLPIFSTLHQNHAVWLISLLKLIDEEKLATEFSYNTCLFDILGMKLKPEKYLDLIKTFVKWGADVNSRTFLRKTPLHIAAQQNNHSVVEFLLSKGANPHLRDLWGRTPLENIRSTNNSLQHASLCKVALISVMGIIMSNRLTFHDNPQKESFLVKAILLPFILQAGIMALRNIEAGNMTVTEMDEIEEKNFQKKSIVQWLEKKCGILNHDFDFETGRDNKKVKILIHEGIEILKFSFMLYLYMNFIYFIS